ncbi:MAG TPA: hypothetical protein VJV74_13675 [Terriglobia bacterium]|nr:hypothetical protein [Terriglobia bacterium]
MDFLYRPLARSIDNLWMRLDSKRPTTRHAPYTRDMRHITDPGFLEEPERFYFRPDSLSEPRIVSERRLHGCRVVELAFPSPVETRWPENNTAYAYHVRLDEDGPHPALVVLHGWGRKSLATEVRHIGLRLARQGIESFFPVLPYHLRRAPAGSWSGEYMISGDIVRTAEGFQQAVVEMRAVIPFLRSRPWLSCRPWRREGSSTGRDSEAVGFLGFSLGGILGHLLMTVEPLPVGITVVAAGNSAGITWEGRLTRYVRADIERAGISFAELERIWSVTNPTLLARHNKVTNLMMMAGKYDQIVPPKFTLELWEALGRPPLRWYPGAHYSSFLFLHSMVDEAARFFRKHI